MPITEPRELTEYKTDHDLLIELRVLLTEMRRDMREMKDGNTAILTDHEVRIRKLENDRVPEDLVKRVQTLEAQSNSWLGKQSVISGGLGIIAGLIGSLISAGKF